MQKPIALTKIINGKEFKIYGADAEVACSVFKSGMLCELLDGEVTKEEIENFVYKSLNDQERVSYAAASEMSVKILKKAIGIDITGLYDKLKNYENTGEFYHSYREHVVHQWRVFLLGLCLIDTIPGVKANLKNRFGESFVQTWTVAALCHDIGYLMERGAIAENKYAEDIVKLLNALNEEGFSVFCPELELNGLLQAQKDEIKRKAKIYYYPIQDWRQLFFDIDHGFWKLEDIESSIMKFEKYYQMTTNLKTKAENRPLFIDHGIASAAILHLLFEQKDYWSKHICMLPEYQCNREKMKHMKLEERKQVYLAIALHNVRPDAWDQDKVYRQYGIALNEFKIRWEEEPLAYLLILCDSLQEWNRPSKDFENRLRNEITSQDMHIMVKDGKIYLCFPSDDLALSKSKDSAYHKIVQTIERLLDCENQIEIIEIGDEQMGKYIDRDLLRDEYKEINTGSKEGDAYELYKKGRHYGNSTEWEKVSI